jgi:hypothetical protein
MMTPQVATLVSNYLAAKPDQIRMTCANLAEGNFEPIRRFGHNLKGTGAGYGFPQLEEIGIRIERAAIARDRQGILEQVDAISRFLESV